MEDLISRQAVLDAIKDERAKSNYANTWIDGALDIRARVVLLPSVTPKSKTGHWIKNSPFTKPYCSECGASCFGLHGFDCTISPYCPNCGAKMEREE